jgi:hypothetical protein
MRCILVNGVCRNCDGTEAGECLAEIDLPKLRAMLSGKGEQRAVKVTDKQLTKLSEPEDCPFRGAMLRTESCESCSGRTRIKVFGCELHQECSFGDLPNIKSCVNCEDSPQATQIAGQGPSSVWIES